MDLRNNRQLQELVRTFAVMNKDGIISTDDEESTDSEVEVTTITEQLEYALPRMSVRGLGPKEASQNEACPGSSSSSANDEHSPSSSASDTSAFYDAYCDQYLEFTNANPTTYHVIEHFRLLLENNGFEYLPEKKAFDQNGRVQKGGLFFTVRGDLSLVAFAIGGSWEASKGIGAIGSHVDSLALKLKPSSIKNDVEGYNMLGVAPYSGSLDRNWVNRDLGIGGKVLVRNKDGSVQKRLISSAPHPIGFIPSLAPHFGAVANQPLNPETQAVPVIGFGGEEQAPTEDEKRSPLYGKHSLGLLRYVSELSHTKVSDMVALDLDLFSTQEGVRGGLNKEFMYALRIDDRLCSFAAIYGLIEFSQAFYKGDSSFEDWDGLNMVFLADNEEIGSKTRTGAHGGFLRTTVDRILGARGETDASLVYANSVILSADVTHALNPNFKSAYLDKHFPVPNKGLTVKMDANAHVATDSVGVALLEQVASKNKLHLQRFHIRNGFPSGGTIGPTLATQTGARVIDVGLAQLSMHRIRALAGYKEAGLGVETFRAFFKDWREVNEAIDAE